MRSIAWREVLQGDVVGGAASGEQGGLVDQVGEVGAGEAGGQGGDFLDGDAGSELDLLQVNLEDLHPALLVRAVDQDLAVEAAGAKQGGVENFGAVGGGEQDDAAASGRSRPFR